MNKKGFTLIELLGVISLLAIIMSIAIPSITSLTERIKKDGYINDAQKMVYLVKKDIKSGMIDKPATGESVKISLEKLSTNELKKDKDGLEYGLQESYVYITRENGELNYYVQLVSDKTDGRKEEYRGISLVNKEELDEPEKYEKYSENITNVINAIPNELSVN